MPPTASEYRVRAALYHRGALYYTLSDYDGGYDTCRHWVCRRSDDGAFAFRRLEAGLFLPPFNSLLLAGDGELALATATRVDEGTALAFTRVSPTLDLSGTSSIYIDEIYWNIDNILAVPRSDDYLISYRDWFAPGYVIGRYTPGGVAAWEVTADELGGVWSDLRIGADGIVRHVAESNPFDEHTVEMTSITLDGAVTERRVFGAGYEIDLGGGAPALGRFGDLYPVRVRRTLASGLPVWSTAIARLPGSPDASGIEFVGDFRLDNASAEVYLEHAGNTYLAGALAGGQQSRPFVAGFSGRLSPTRAPSPGGRPREVSVAPNPARPGQTARLPADVDSWTLVDALGHRVTEVLAKAQWLVVPEVAPGVYRLVGVDAEGRTYAAPLMVR